MTEPTKVEKGKYSKQFPNLGYILGYFHEDMFDGFEWNGRQPNYEGVIKYIKTQDSLTVNEKAPSEFREFLSLSQNWDEDKLSDVLSEDFVCMYRAPFFKMTYREFLEGILEILEEPMEKIKSEFIPQRNLGAGWGNDGWIDYVDEETKRMLNMN